MKGRIRLLACVMALLSFPLLAHAASITVTSPTGQDVWYIGGTYTITWTSTLSPDKAMAIKLLDASKNEVLVIAKPTPNDNQEDWTIPNTVSPGTYIIRVKRKGKPIYGDSEPFTIAAPKIEVQKPGAGFTWVKGHSYAVRWKNFGNPGNRVNIILLSSRGYQVKTLASNHPNNCTNCLYTCPASAYNDVPAGDYMIKVETTDHAYSDTSGVFHIEEPSGESGGSDSGSSLGDIYIRGNAILTKVPYYILHGVKVPPQPEPEPEPWWYVSLGDLTSALKQKGVKVPLVFELVKGNKTVAKLAKYNPSGTLTPLKGVQLTGGTAKFKLPSNKAREIASTGGAYKLIIRNAKTGQILKTLSVTTSSNRPMMKRPMMKMNRFPVR